MARLLSLQKYSADRHRADGMCAGMLIAADNFCSAEWNRFRYQISRNGEAEGRKRGVHTVVLRCGIGGFSALEGVALWSWWLNPKSHVYRGSLPYRPALALWNQVRRDGEGEGGMTAIFCHLGSQFESYIWRTAVFSQSHWLSYQIGFWVVQLKRIKKGAKK